MAVEVGGASVELRADGIIHCVAKTKQKHTLQDAKAIIGTVRALSDGRLLPLLLDMTVSGGIERDAQKYYNEDVAVSSMAIVTGSSLGRVIANFIIGMSEGKLPVRLFDDEASAIAWLRSLPK